MKYHATVACVLTVMTFLAVGCGPRRGEIDQLQIQLRDSNKKLSRLQTELDQTLVLLDDVWEDWWNADERARAFKSEYEDFKAAVQVKLRRADNEVAKARRQVAAMTRTHESDVAVAKSADEVITGL
ncbi:MAG: hypothetical protein J7M14_02845, partial [Planctomycetes bacterium]|nr:hypothetical protein [Planctomycetota bacterium]